MIVSVPSIRCQVQRVECRLENLYDSTIPYMSTVLMLSYCEDTVHTEYSYVHIIYNSYHIYTYIFNSIHSILDAVK